MPTIEQINDARVQLTQMVIQNWRNEDFLTWSWWLLLAILVVPWIIWWFVVDKKRINQILTFGLMTAIVTGLVDVVGIELGWYVYPHKLIPFAPRLLPYVLGMLPVIYMLVYQYFPHWRSFSWALLAVSGILAFIVQPITTALGMYKLISWTYLYSFVVYVAVGVVFRAINEYFVRAGEAADQELSGTPDSKSMRPAIAKPLRYKKNQS